MSRVTNRDKRLKVAFLSFAFAEYCLRLANALTQKVGVCLLLPSSLAAPYISQLDQTVNFQPFQKWRLRQPWQQIRTLRAIHRDIKAFEPDLIHIQQGHFWFNLTLPLLRRYPLALTIHDPRHHIGDKVSQKTPQKILDFGFRRADRIIVHSHQIKERVVTELRISPEIVHVIPHIVLGDDTACSQVQADDPSILFFGRIWAYKGLEHLIRAEPLITAQVPDTKIIIAGQGDDFAHYRRMMVHPERFIIYNEYISDEKRAELFRQASVVVLPYIEATQSGVIPVAYTFAKPVVATRVGGLPEMVDHGQTGYLVPPGDEKTLAAAVVSLLQNKTLRQQFGENGKRRIDTECSPDVVAQQTLAVYHQVINDRYSSAGEMK